jgi:PKD repeat protein
MKKKLSLLYLFFILTASVFGQINLSSSLTACYSLNSNANDPISSLNGTLSAVTPTVDRFNNAGNAYSFNGTISSYIKLPDNPLLKPTNAISFSCWVKANIVSNQYVIFTKNTVFSNFEAYSLSISNQSGPGRFYLSKGNGGLATAINNTITAILTNTWYHVVCTVDNTTLRIYVNGNLENTTSTTLNFSYDIGKNIYFGGSNEPSFNLPFNGTLDNVRFYNRILNAAEVGQLYNLDPTCLPPPTASFSVSASTVCINQPISLTDLSVNTPTAWAWQMAGASPSVSSSNNPVITYTSAGVYTISLVSSNAYGSSIAVTQTVNVSACTYLKQNNTTSQIEIYPNPNNGKFVINISDANEFVLFNILGEVVLTKRCDEVQKTQIDISDKPNGVYFLNIKVGNNSVTRKIIKE